MQWIEDLTSKFVIVSMNEGEMVKGTFLGCDHGFIFIHDEDPDNYGESCEGWEYPILPIHLTRVTSVEAYSPRLRESAPPFAEATPSRRGYQPMSLGDKVVMTSDKTTTTWGIPKDEKEKS